MGERTGTDLVDECPADFWLGVAYGDLAFKHWTVEDERALVDAKRGAERRGWASACC